MNFLVLACMALAFVVLGTVGVNAKRELQVKLVRPATDSGLVHVKDLNQVKMPCEGKARGYKASCVRSDGKWWGCEGDLVCVMKTFKFGKCLKLADKIPTDSTAWIDKNKGVTCSSRNPVESPIDDQGKKHAPDDGNSCSAADYAKGCPCAGAQWRCADACDLTAKACDVGFSCLRKTNNAYAICATQELIDKRGQTDFYDPRPIPCGENVGTWNILPGSKKFGAGPMTGVHASRCEALKKKQMEHDHSGHRHLSWVRHALGMGHEEESEFWDEEPEWHQDFVASQIEMALDA